MFFLRVSLIWLAIICAEIVDGILRTKLLLHLASALEQCSRGLRRPSGWTAALRTPYPDAFSIGCGSISRGEVDECGVGSRRMRLAPIRHRTCSSGSVGRSNSPRGFAAAETGSMDHGPPRSARDIVLILQHKHGGVIGGASFPLSL